MTTTTLGCADTAAHAAALVQAADLTKAGNLDAADELLARILEATPMPCTTRACCAMRRGATPRASR
jgi:hypothetical protein